MSAGEMPIGVWPNIAIDPATGRKAVTGEEVEVPSRMSKSYDQERYDRWYNSLFHGEPSSYKELVEDIVWTTETVDLGPNGNEYQGIDEGEVLTECLIESWAREAATLDSGTCKNVHEPPRNSAFWPTPHFKCSECGATHVSMDYVFHCPKCGAKVVDE